MARTLDVYREIAKPHFLRIGDIFVTELESRLYGIKVQDTSDTENKVTCMFEDLYLPVDRILPKDAFKTSDDLDMIVDNYLSTISVTDMLDFSNKDVTLRLPTVSDIMGSKGNYYTDKFIPMKTAYDRFRGHKRSFKRYIHPYLLKRSDEYEKKYYVVDVRGEVEVYDEDILLKDKQYDNLFVCPVFDLYF